MKVLCNREAFLTGWSLVSGVVPARSPKQILQNIKLVVDPDGDSTLLATDLEVGIRYRVLGLKIDRGGAAILPTNQMGQILRTSADEELAIEADSEHLVVRGQHAHFKLPGEDADAFPDVPDFAAADFHVVAASDLRRAIRRTVFATDVESTRYALGGVLFELDAESLTLVGTDGRRLARQVIALEAEGSPKPPAGQPVVPVKALKLIERNLQDQDPPVHLAFQANTSILARTDRSVIYSRLVEGRFPRYQDVFPTQVEVKIALQAGSLLRAVEQASIVTSDESRSVDFHFESGVLKLNSQAPDQGSSDIELAIDYDGKPIAITFDPRYLADSLRTLDEDAALTVELVDSKNPAVFKTGDRYTYVVMPLTR